ncbi:DNA replication complex GINS protein SLD5 [Neocloeon triangulifer]|uniref:DNA replication complex GINS protein SLD5 n=1 Tax=Neocloeon triangulifer TaxID=2078957 RepID=UPI00286F4285|nr:DNA replication complex GINS protein SLD5 [Neocloeon triangulifer]XP_059478578.1 DNA replication complex GINS protein SLD5 [Neocloeon triangulifer]
MASSSSNTFQDSDLQDLGLSDDEPETASGVLNKFQAAWINEKFSPELLPYQGDFVECLIEQIKYMDNNVRKLDKRDIRSALHALELSRIKYMITDYLRVRLSKIERFTFSILEAESSRSGDDLYLSEGEFQFAKDHFANTQTALQTIALRHFPRPLASFEPTKMAVQPPLNSYVFVKATKAVSGLILPSEDPEEPDEEVDLDENSQHILPYQPVANLVKSGSVKLI